MDLPNVAGVEFKEVVGLEGYAVGDDGSVWSKRRNNIWRMLKMTVSVAGYHVVTTGPAHKQFKVHRLVAAAFIGACPVGLCVNHMDGVKTNNRPGNLEYVTIGENNSHASRTGLSRQNPGESNHRAKMRDTEISEAIEMLKAGKTQDEVAAFFGVSQSCISKYRRGERRTTSGAPMGEVLSVPENRGGDISTRRNRQCA